MARRLKHVNVFRDRHGTVRFYFRRRGYPNVPLPGAYGSAEFMTAYTEALAGGHIEIGADNTMPGTVDALVVSYYKSAAWASLSVDTHRKRRYLIERFRNEHGTKRVALLRREHIVGMLAKIERPTVKRNWLIAVRALLQSGIPAMLKDDPTIGLSIKLPKSKGHHDWTDAEIQQYRDFWPFGAQQRLVFEFALETMSRRGEVVRLGPQHIRNGRIHIERLKGSNDVDIELSPQLQAACEAMPKAHLTYITTASGGPRSKGGLGFEFAKWATAAGLPPRCRMHGLKKSGMRRGAEAGNTAHELMALSGQKTLAMVQHYTDAADKKRLADSGMAKRRAAQNANENVTNLPTPSYKPEAK